MSRYRYLQRTNERVIDPAYAGDIFIWDIDKTYLDNINSLLTRFHLWGHWYRHVDSLPMNSNCQECGRGYVEIRRGGDQRYFKPQYVAVWYCESCAEKLGARECQT